MKGNLSKWTESISDITKVIELNPENSQAYYFRGLARVFSDKINYGCLDFSKAGELGKQEAYDLIKEYCN